jgi:predicted Fe-Mo cluster-binding NifX family protein
MLKIAITSNDGEMVNEHFGRASTLYIYKLADEGLSFIEKRDVESYCSEENHEKSKEDHAFSADRFDKVYNAMEDCHVLYTHKIGDTPLEKLKQKGIEVQLCSCAIESIGKCSGKCNH